MNGRQKYKSQAINLVLLHVLGYFAGQKNMVYYKRPMVNPYILGYFACQKNVVYYKRTTGNPSKKYIERI